MFKHETQVINFLLQWYSVNARNLPWRKKNNLNFIPEDLKVNIENKFRNELKELEYI